MAEFAIGNRMVGDGHPTLAIAEIGVNHLGNYDIAEAMIEAAADAGADAVKLQCHIPDEEMTEGVPSQVVDTIRRCALTIGQERDLKAYAESLDLIFLSTPFSIAAADRLQALGVLAFKIGSGELTNTPLLERVASFAKPVFLSTGMATFGEIDAALDAIGYPDGVVLMHCTSIYPTPPEHVRLGRMMALCESGYAYGLSDHSTGIACALAAVALGASVIEKHFTISHGFECPDAAVSIDPEELAQLTGGARAIRAAMDGVEICGSWRGGRAPLPAELEVAAWARHSVTLRAPVTAGETLTAEHLTTKRPAGGIPAARMRECIGRTVTRDLPANAQLQESDLA